MLNENVFLCKTTNHDAGTSSSLPTVLDFIGGAQFEVELDEDQNLHHLVQVLDFLISVFQIFFCG